MKKVAKNFGKLRIISYLCSINKKHSINNQNKVTMETTNFIEFCKEFINNNIFGYEGQSHYGCDLANYITEGINCDGSVTYNAYKSKELLNEWWYDCADFVDYYKDNSGEMLNPFDNVERFICIMVICGVDMLIAQSETAQSIWDEDTELTHEILQKIVNEVEELTEIGF